jgi:hypothetical protein
MSINEFPIPTRTVQLQKILDAEVEAQNAANSAAAALASEQAAATSETNAGNSASAALTSEQNALASEQAAATSEQNASTSETNAGNSASAALTSEQNALASEQAASQSETNAATSEQNALASEQAAALSESNAATSEQNASTSEANALASEQAAATSETNAGNSASAALTSEQNALASEQAAALSESNAATSEQNALASEQNAASSASAALTSEQNAGTSETNASNSAAAALLSEQNAAQSASDAEGFANSINPADIEITGGTINGTTIGATTASTGAFTTLSASTSLTTPLVTNAGTLALSATGANIVTASTNGVERLRIASNGRVGIGVSSPNTALDVNGVINVRTNGFEFGRITTNNTSATNGGLTFQTLQGGVFDERMRIDSAGRVGIGTTSPAANLSVSSSALAALSLSSTDEATDQKNWHFQYGTAVGAGTFRLRAINDANTNGQNAYIITRSGIGVQTHQWLTANTERMRIDSVGNVGIGTSSPLQRLDVVGNIQLGNPTQNQTADHTIVNNVISDPVSTARGAITLGLTAGVTSSDSFISFTTNKFGVSRAERMRIDPTGNVGIGTTAPNDRLNVVGGGATIAGSASGFTGGEVRLGTTAASTQNAISTISTGTPEMYFDHRGSDTGVWVWRSNLTERMRIDSAGNVGIGTSSPSERLTVATGTSEFAIQFGGPGKDWVFGSASNRMYLRNKTDAFEALTVLNGGNVGIGTSSPAGALTVASSGGAGVSIAQSNENFYAGSLHRFFDLSYANERARIDASGNLLVGTTSTSTAGFGNPVATFDSSGKNGAMFQTPGSVDSGTTIMSSRVSNGIHAAFFQSGSNIGSITTNGTATAYNTSSDYRLKEDVQPMVGASDRLMALKPVNFAWKVDGSRVDGFLAHEAQEVVPEAVTGSKDAVDKDGKPQYQGIDQSKLVPLLTAALQEALQKIEALEARITALEA